MGKTRAGGWIAGTVFLVLVIFALTYFFVAAPRLASAAATIELADQARAKNVLLTQQTAVLKADFERLEEYRAEVAALQLQIPAQAKLSEYTRTLTAAAETHGVTVTAVTPGVPTAVVLPAPVAPVAQPTEDEAADGEAAEAPAAEDGVVAPPTPVAASPLEGLVAMPITFTVMGPQAAAMSFLNQMQSGTERLLLVTSLNIQQQDAGDTSSGKPATAAGDVELVVGGQLYVLKPVDVVPVVPVADGSVPPALPSSDRNPFTPLPGKVPASRD